MQIIERATTTIQPESARRRGQLAGELAPTAPAIAATATALPRHHYAQRDLAMLAAQYIGGSKHRETAVERFFDRVGVGERNLALPAEEYARLGGMERRSKAFIEVATELGEQTITSLLAESGLAARDVAQLTTTTVTGIAVPSLDARLMNRLPFATSLKRVPLFGLGCLGGAAGLARTAEYLRAFPEEAAIFLSVELCSLTFQPDDVSVANLVSTGLFGDGAAAVLLVGARHPLAIPLATRTGSYRPGAVGQPRIVASRSVFFPDTERVMGWDVVDTGFKVVLSAAVPDIVRQHVPPAVDGFLAEHGLRRQDIATWVMHPGGPKVIDALEESLALPADALAPTRDGLARLGNLSSASVLFLLDEYRRRRAPPPGSFGVLMAMGPAFCAEIVLLRW
jgi:alkylresorcinol/alkylpyrone synthase